MRSICLLRRRYLIQHLLQRKAADEEVVNVGPLCLLPVHREVDSYGTLTG